MKLQMKACSDMLADLMENDNEIIILTADLVGTCKINNIEKYFPDRFINVGVAEQNMVSIAAGLAHEGYKPFVYSFAAFASLRSCEQVRTDAFYNNLNVKVIGTHSGISAGPAGSTHFSIEDIGVIRSMPNSMIVIPSDAMAAKKLIKILVELDHPVYFRIDRNPLPEIYTEEDEFEIGKAKVLCEGNDILLCATGVMVSIASEVAQMLENNIGVSATVLDIHTIKPLDNNAIIKHSKGIKHIVSLEEHNIYGGLGSAVAEIIAENNIDCFFKRIGINDIYPIGGPVNINRERLGLSKENIFKTIQTFINN